MQMSHHPSLATAALRASASDLRVPRVSIGYAGLLFLFFCAPFSVSAYFQYFVPGIQSSVLFILTTASLLGLHVLSIRRLRVDATVAVVVGLLFVPMLFSFVLVPLNALATGIDYSDYASADVWRRMLNVFLFGGVFLVGSTVLLELSEMQRRRILQAYFAALCIFVAVGLWQWGSFYLGLPFPDLGSRTYLHGVSREIAMRFPGRVTSLATEPSFVAPLMIDAAILGAAIMGMTGRYFALVFLPAAWVLVFSFSGGGFFNLLVLGGFGLVLGLYDLLGRSRVSRGFLIAVGLGAIAAVALNGPIRQLLVPIVGRLELLFDLQAHDRMYMVVMPFFWFAGDGILAALFGHGPGSFTLLQQMHRLPDGGPFHVTSNNLFTDVLYEQGLIGLLLVVAFFAILLAIGLRGRHRGREYLLGAILTVHLAASSVYRADFMAPRFWVVVLSIFILYHAGGSTRARWNSGPGLTNA